MTGLATDYRGTSPLGHHGESENYFTLLDARLAFDHKHKAAYNALTYLLADAIAEVKRMIDAGTGWTAEKIQDAVEEAGFDIDVEDAARPEFDIPETPISAALVRDISSSHPFIPASRNRITV